MDIWNHRVRAVGIVGFSLLLILATCMPSVLAADGDRPSTATDAEGKGGGRPADGKPAATQPVKPEEPKKYKPASEAQIAANRKLAMEMAEKTRQTIVPTMHFVESPHFWIFSAWNRSNDKALVRACEEMYVTLCRQFDIPPTENIWAGKCAVYIFWEKEHYEQFVETVDEVGHPDAGGYQGRKGRGLSYIVLNRTRRKTSFYELLAHEGTHAFVGRYINDRHIISWANEGIAETMAAELVDGSDARKRPLDAFREAVREDRSVMPVFKEFTLDRFDYGAAQGLVRILIAKDRKAFAEFFELMKEGKSDEQALEEAYGITRIELAKAWHQAAARAVPH